MLEQYQGFLPEIEYFVERRAWPDWKLPETEIDFFDINYIISGRVFYFIDKKPIKLQAGDVVFVRKGQLRQAYTDPEEPMHCFNFNFTYKEMKGRKIKFPFPSSFKAGIDAELIKSYKKFNRLWLEDKPANQLECRGLFLMILSRLIKKNENFEYNSDLRIEKIKQYIVNNYQQEIKIKQLAGLVNLNHIYLGHLFKEVTGITVNQYINMIRVNMTEDLLLTNECNVSEAAYRCGFNDPFYFSKVFKEIKKVSPSRVISYNTR
ncbi:MAG: AraC family transcriptional regulator [Halanaerobiaceae bacterium]